jgi:hypothetical protein
MRIVTKGATSMKPLSLVAIAVLIVCSVLTPAPAAAQNVQVGLTGGFGLTSLALTPEPPATLSHPMRPDIGGLVAFGLSNAVSLELRLARHSKAVRWADTTAAPATESTVHINYLSVPVLVRIGARTGHARPYCVVGGEVAFKTGASLGVSLRNPPPNTPSPTTQDLNDQVQPTDVAIDAGVGLEVPAGRVSVFFEGLYSHGLRNIAVSPANYFDIARTRTVHLNAGIRF